MNSLGERWLNLQMPEHGRFLSACSRVGEVQTARLKALVRANAETAFGQAHDFSDIRTPADFADQVPVGDHATNVQPWLDRNQLGVRAY